MSCNAQVEGAPEDRGARAVLAERVAKRAAFFTARKWLLGRPKDVTESKTESPGPKDLVALQGSRGPTAKSSPHGSGLRRVLRIFN